MKTVEIPQIESDIRHFRIEQQTEDVSQSAQLAKPGVPVYIVYLLAVLICVVAFNV